MKLRDESCHGGTCEGLAPNTPAACWRCCEVTPGSSPGPAVGSERSRPAAGALVQNHPKILVAVSSASCESNNNTNNVCMHTCMCVCVSPCIPVCLYLAGFLVPLTGSKLHFSSSRKLTLNACLANPTMISAPQFYRPCSIDFMKCRHTWYTVFLLLHPTW